MTALVSRVLVAAVLLPVVLLLIWAGGWWMIGLAVVAGMVALHELYVMTRNLRPVLLAGYAGTLATLIGAAWGPEWALAGFFSTLPLAFLFKAASGALPSAASVSVTVLGSAWIGLGLAFLVLLRELPEHGFLTVLTVVLAVFASDTMAFAAGRMLGRHKMAPLTSPGKTWEGFVAGTIAAVLVPFFAFYDEDFLTVPRPRCSHRRRRARGRPLRVSAEARRRCEGQRPHLARARRDARPARRLSLHRCRRVLPVEGVRRGMMSR